jgi:acyl carrier protein
MLEGLLPAAPTAPALPRGSVRAEVLALPSGPEQVRALRGFLRDQVGAILGTTGGRVDGTVPFQELGFDSLMAVELRNRLETALDIRLSAALVFAHPTVDELAEGLLGRLAPAGAPAPAPLPAVAIRPAEPAIPDDLSMLDDDELSALLARELDPMEER